VVPELNLIRQNASLTKVATTLLASPTYEEQDPLEVDEPTFPAAAKAVGVSTGIKLGIKVRARITTRALEKR
jgi:D-alanyl-D-alanine carboxypeptidase